VSAALTVLSSDKPSDEAGLFKEELDADGGSGFSFADLAADRSGTTFAVVATRDEEAARAVQERLRGRLRGLRLLPPAADLPEGIDDAAFQSRYGGVGGPLYLRDARGGRAARRPAAPPTATRSARLQRHQQLNAAAPRTSARGDQRRRRPPCGGSRG
jgi:hypothetical protein